MITVDQTIPTLIIIILLVNPLWRWHVVLIIMRLYYSGLKGFILPLRTIESPWSALQNTVTSGRLDKCTVAASSFKSERYYHYSSYHCWEQWFDRNMVVANLIVVLWSWFISHFCQNQPTVIISIIFAAFSTFIISIILAALLTSKLPPFLSYAINILSCACTHVYHWFRLSLFLTVGLHKSFPDAVQTHLPASSVTESFPLSSTRPV